MVGRHYARALVDPTLSPPLSAGGDSQSTVTQPASYWQHTLRGLQPIVTGRGGRWAVACLNLEDEVLRGSAQEDDTLA